MADFYLVADAATSSALPLPFPRNDEQLCRRGNTAGQGRWLFVKREAGVVSAPGLALAKHLQGLGDAPVTSLLALGL